MKKEYSFIGTIQENLSEKKSEFHNLDKPLKELDLSVRAYNCLKSGDINTLGDIISTPISKLKSFRLLGQKTIGELNQVAKDYGYELGQNIDYVSPKNRK